MEAKNIHLRYGFITALVAIVVGLVLYYTGNMMASWGSYLIYAVMLAGIVMNCMAYSKANNGAVTFGKVFSSGLKASAVFTLVMLVWTLLSQYLFPEMQEAIMEAAAKEMQKGKMTDEQIDAAMEMTSKYQTLFMVAGVVFGYMIVGIVFALIGAAIAKKKPKEFTPDL